MLDKSIEFFKIILKREKEKELKDETLPEGFRFVKLKNLYWNLKMLKMEKNILKTNIYLI